MILTVGQIKKEARMGKTSEMVDGNQKGTDAPPLLFCIPRKIDKLDKNDFGGRRVIG